MKDYKAYLFDFDYTLADSSQGIVKCYRNVLNRHGFTSVSDDDIKRTIGKTLEESFSIFTDNHDPEFLARLKKEYGEYAKGTVSYQQICADAAEMAPKAQGAIDYLV